MLGHLVSRDRFRNHLGIVLAAIHVIWFLAATATLGRHRHAGTSFLPGGSSSATLFAGRPFHFEYEALIMKLLVLADIPAALTVALLEKLLCITDAFLVIRLRPVLHRRRASPLCGHDAMDGHWLVR